jgi:hypothetical protein
VVPAPIEAADDKSDAYVRQADGNNCFSYLPRFADRTCQFGDEGSPRRVVLVGNSHAGQWLPALQQVADDQGFEVSALLASRCAYADVEQEMDTAAHARACLDWVHRTTARIVRLHPELVVMANRVSSPALGFTRDTSGPAYRDGYESVLRSLAAAGIRTLVLRDTPAPGRSIPDCVAEKQADYDACDGTRSAWMPQTPEVDAVRAVDSPLVTLADLTDHICGPTVCSAVTGGVITYFDASHLSATYARTLAPYLAPVLTGALAAG